MRSTLPASSSPTLGSRLLRGASRNAHGLSALGTLALGLGVLGLAFLGSGFLGSGFLGSGLLGSGIRGADLARAAVAEENPPAADGDESKEEPTKAKKDLAALAAATPKEFEDLVEAARSYFDLDEPKWSGRKAFLEQLALQADAGNYWLKDMNGLRWLIYQSRSFHPPMTDRKWRARQGIDEYKAVGGTIYEIKSEELTIAFSVPRKYPKPKDFRRDYPRDAPYPVILAMHDKEDYTGEKYPGATLMKRRYPKKVWKELYEKWIVLCPVAAAGNYLNKQKMIRAEAFQQPYSTFWKHYHIDFDRVILDGSEQAFAAAASQAIFFSGIVFRNSGRKKWELKDDAMKANVKNFAPVPVYVVDNPKLAEQLKEAGHPNVTAGIGGPNLYEWMGERRRVEPKTFDWAVQRVDQVLPYWVNIEGAKWDKDVTNRSLKLDVVDTEKEPNTIKIDAVGLLKVALFLNDDVIDLDRKVRVVINGNIEFDGEIEVSDAMKKIGRDFDVLFDRDPARIRLSMFFGFLKTGRIVGLEVRARAKKAEPEVAPADEGPAATPDEEALSKRYLAKAKKFIEGEKMDLAKDYLQKVLDLPRNAQTEEAKQLLAECEAK